MNDAQHRKTEREEEKNNGGRGGGRRNLRGLKDGDRRKPLIFSKITSCAIYLQKLSGDSLLTCSSNAVECCKLEEHDREEHKIKII